MLLEKNDKKMKKKLINSGLLRKQSKMVNVSSFFHFLSFFYHFSSFFAGFYSFSSVSLENDKTNDKKSIKN